MFVPIWKGFTRVVLPTRVERTESSWKRGERLAQDNSTGVQGQWAELRESRAGRDEVFQGLRQNGRIFANADPAELLQNLDRLVQMGAPNYAVAGALLNRFGSNSPSSMMGMRGGISLNERALQSELEAIQTAGRSERTDLTAGMQANMRAVQAAQAGLARAEADLQAVLQQAQLRPGVSRNIPERVENLRRQNELLEQAMARMGPEDNWRRRRQPSRGEQAPVGNRASAPASPSSAGARAPAEPEVLTDAQRRVLQRLEARARQNLDPNQAPPSVGFHNFPSLPGLPFEVDPTSQGGGSSVQAEKAGWS
jgi:hypothetical protein